MRLSPWFVGVAIVVSPAVARADEVTGMVLGATGRWTSAKTIVTDATIATDDGRVVTVTQLGGHVDGLAMVTFDVPPPMRAGDRVRVTATAGRNLRGEPRLAADDVLYLAGGASRFVRTPNKYGSYLYWPTGCAFVSYANGTGDLPGDTELEIMDQALATWNDAVASCSYLTTMTAPPEAVEFGYDGVNMVRFRDSWCRPATDDDMPMCLSPSAAGLTTAVFVEDTDSSRDGELLDADVELNAEHFRISANGESMGTGPCDADLANTFTHEIGHLLGLEHTCLADDDPPRIDGNGDPVPRCNATADPVITEATMYPFQDCGETKKASPEPDDVAGICAIYPAADDPMTCEEPERVDEPGCCSTGGGNRNSAALLAALLAIITLRRRRI